MLYQPPLSVNINRNIFLYYNITVRWKQKHESIEIQDIYIRTLYYVIIHFQLVISVLIHTKYIHCKNEFVILTDQLLPQLHAHL